MKRIIVATDGSDGGDRAVETAAELAKATGARLMILTVGGDITGAELRRLAGSQGDLGQTLKTRSNRILAQARKVAQRLGVSDPVLRCKWGDPAEVIVETAQRDKADAVVIGRRGRSRLSELLLGSVSQKVTSLAPCRVIVVP
jgi:nucleotide-binding universal stress UspA family protein